MQPRSPLNPTGDDERDLDANQIRNAQQCLSWLGPLLENPHFQKLWSMVDESVQQLAAAGLDLKKTPEERNNFAQQHHVLKFWLLYPTVQRDACLRALKAHEARQEAQAAQPAPVP